MLKRLMLASSVSLAAISAAHAQQAPPTPNQYPVYDESPDWGLSNAGVPPGPYFKGAGGHSWGAGSRFDDSWVYGGGLGYRFAPFFRSDVTLDYRPDFHDRDAGGAKFTNWSAMLNGYVDFNVPIIRPLIPYIGAGVGVSQNKVNGTVVTVSGTTTESIFGSRKDQFAWHAIAGVSYYVTTTAALDVSYRYFHGGSAESTTGTGFPSKGDFNTHEVVGYVRFGF